MSGRKSGKENKIIWEGNEQRWERKLYWKAALSFLRVSKWRNIIRICEISTQICLYFWNFSLLPKIFTLWKFHLIAPKAKCDFLMLHYVCCNLGTVSNSPRRIFGNSATVNEIDKNKNKNNEWGKKFSEQANGSAEDWSQNTGASTCGQC